MQALRQSPPRPISHPSPSVNSLSSHTLIKKSPFPDQETLSSQSHDTGQTIELSASFAWEDQPGVSESAYSEPGLAEVAFSQQGSPGLFHFRAGVQGSHAARALEQRLQDTEASSLSPPPLPSPGTSAFGAALGPDLFLPADLPTWAEYAPEDDAIGTAWTELVTFEEAVSPCLYLAAQRSLSLLGSSCAVVFIADSLLDVDAAVPARHHAPRLCDAGAP